MKYLVAYLVAMILAGVFMLRHPLPDSMLPAWLEVIASPLIVTVPLCTVCRLLTRNLGGLRARFAEAAILFCVLGGFWALTEDLTVGGRVASPLEFWFGLTWTSWVTTFLPFTASLAVMEWWGARRQAAVTVEMSK